MTDLRALIAELADELDHNRQCLLDDRRLTHPLSDKARAALGPLSVAKQTNGLSTPAQAVLDAAFAVEDEWDTIPMIAAALRAAADQVVPLTSKPDDTFCCPPVATIVWNALMDARQQLLAIAAELEAQ